MRVITGIVFLVVFLAGLASTLLVSRDVDVAYFLARDGQVRQARELYRAEYHNGSPTAQITSPLVRLNLELGNFEEAESMLRNYLEQHPHEPGALTDLAAVFDAEGRREEQLGVLRELAAVHPKRKAFVAVRELAIELGNEEVETAALRALKNSGESTAEEQFSLARLLAVSGERDEAVKMLRALRYSGAPDVMSAIPGLLLQVLFDAGRTDEEIARIAWELKPSVTEQAQLVWQAIGKGRPAVAAQLLGPTEGAIRTPALVAAALATEHARGGSAGVVRLGRTVVDSALSPDALSELALAAIDQRDDELLIKVVEREGIADFRDQAILTLLSYRVRKRELPVGTALGRAFGQASVTVRFQDSALLREARALVIPETGRGVARVADRKNVLATLSVADLTALLDLVDEIEDRQAAFDIIDLLDRAPGLDKPGLVSDYHIARIVLVLLDHGFVERAWTLASKEFATRRGDTLLRPWALAAIAAGKKPDLVRVVRSDLRFSRPLLWELVGRLEKAGDTTTALLALERLALLDPRDQRVARTQARVLLASGGDIEVFSGVLSRITPGPDDLTLVPELGRKTTNPAIARLIENRIVALASDREGLSEKDRRGLGYLLLERFGKRDLAESIFVELAAGRGPDSDDLHQLLHLWGPRPPAAARSWLGKQSAASNAEARKGWFAILVEADCSAELVSLVGNGSERLSAEEFLSYVRALQDFDKKESITAAFERRARTLTNPDEARRSSRLALGLDLESEADIMLRRAFELKGHGLSLALLALERGRRQDAQRLLEEYFSKTRTLAGSERQNCSREELEGRLAYARILIGEGKRSEARQPLEEVATRFGGECSPHFGEDWTSFEVQALVLLERRREAIERMRSLSDTERKQLRGELANLLLDDERLDEARSVLADR